MARYTGAVCRLCRREDMKLILKGERCYTDKCGYERRSYPPGQHGQSRRRKRSDYGEQLREKQKVKRIYGIAERQFRGYYHKALKATGLRRLVVAGGVGANAQLRRELDHACAKARMRVHYPELALCTDNGAMIALAAALRVQRGRAAPAFD